MESNPKVKEWKRGDRVVCYDEDVASGEGTVKDIVEPDHITVEWDEPFDEEWKLVLLRKDSPNIARV